MYKLYILCIVVLLCAGACNKKKENSVARAKNHIVLVMDAAHGGSDSGTKANTGKLEKDLVLDVCKKTKEIAGEYNIEVLLTRTEDANMSPDERKNTAVAGRADIFISIHINKSVASVIKGYEIFVAPGETREAESRALAAAVMQRLKMAGKDTLLTERNVLVLTGNTLPAIAVECGDIDKTEDVATMEDREQLCRYLLSSVVAFVNAK